MPDYTSATFMIKTKDGHKGPFTHQQICKLVIKGQLAESVMVREVETNKSVLVGNIVSGEVYQDEFENQALGIASDLLDEVIHDTYATRPVKKADDAQSSTNRSRRTQSHKRRVNSSRVFESEIAEGVQRTVRKTKKDRNKQSLMVAIGIVALCGIIALIAILIPSGDMQGTWKQGTQTLTIGATVIKLTDGETTVIHTNYQVSDGPNGPVISAKRFDDLRSVKIDIISVSGDSMSTVFDNTERLTWVRQP